MDPHEKIKFVGYTIIWVLGFFVIPGIQSILLVCAPVYIGIFLPNIVTATVGSAALVILGKMYKRVATYAETSAYKSFIAMMCSKPDLPTVFFTPQYYFHISLVWLIYQIPVMFIVQDSVECGAVFVSFMACICFFMLAFILTAVSPNVDSSVDEKVTNV
jgi:hypothetical protein